jgi:hypothetical protein
MSENNGKARIVLSRKEAFRAAHYLETHWAKYTNMTRSQVVAELSTEFGKQLEVHHLSQLLDDMGREFPGIHAGGTQKRKLAAGEKNKFDRPRFLARQLLKLARTVSFLCDEMGVPADKLPGMDIDTLAKLAKSLPTEPPTGK